MPDIARLSPTLSDHDGPRHTLSLPDVEAQLLAAGVPRSHRHVQRMCESGMLDAVKIPGACGNEWVVAPQSLPKAIADFARFQDRRDRHSAPQRAMSGHGAPELSPDINPDTAGYSAPQRATSDRVAAAIAGIIRDRHGDRARHSPPWRARCRAGTRSSSKSDIALMKGQLVAKDEQIGELSTRPGNPLLLGAMQRMLAPLLGQSDPYKAARPARRSREVASGLPLSPQQGLTANAGVYLRNGAYREKPPGKRAEYSAQQRRPIAQHGFTQFPNFILSQSPNSRPMRKRLILSSSVTHWHNKSLFPRDGASCNSNGSSDALSRTVSRTGGFQAARNRASRGQGKTNFYTINFVVAEEGQNNESPDLHPCKSRLARVGI